MATITINRDTRDLLRHELVTFNGISDLRIVFENAVGLDARSQRDPQAVRDIVAEANFIVAILDQLGWSAQDDRQEYEVEVDDAQIRSWLARKQISLRNTIDDEAADLRRLIREDEETLEVIANLERDLDETRVA